MKIGDKIPHVLGTDNLGRQLTADDFAGKPMIIYFYPKDNTPGCTAEACSFRDGYERLLSMGFALVGVSKDSAASHNRFIEKFSLPFPLIADEDTSLNKAFGVWQKKKMAGREYMGTVRTTFITDADHVITHIITKVDTKNSFAQIVKELGIKNES
ncbi:MAG: peroxiredoxin [Muribaculaceae bacterium]|nr:peroxiredoxin [Muribaculaceae bacterium]